MSKSHVISAPDELLLLKLSSGERFPDETPYVYQPFVGMEDQNRFTAQTREEVIRDYDSRDIRL